MTIEGSADSADEVSTQTVGRSADATSGGAPGSWHDPGWHRVSPKYAWADLTLNLLFVLIVGIAFAIVALVSSDSAPLGVLIGLPTAALLLLVNALLAFRRVRAIGYVLREDDLLFRRGILFERIIAVPYGRLQLVDVTRGPLLRALGLSTLKFVTASAATGVNLPGLPEHEAEQLRDKLVALAETRRSGL
ncbi:PH domain-containing protein [Leucobacter sp. GX24907]